MIIVMHIYLLKKPSAVANPNNNDKELVFQNYAPFTDCVSETNNTQIDNAKDIDVVIPMYNSTEYSNNYLKTSEVLYSAIEVNQL